MFYLNLIQFSFEFIFSTNGNINIALLFLLQQMIFIAKLIHLKSMYVHTSNAKNIYNNFKNQLNLKWDYIMSNNNETKKSIPTDAGALSDSYVYDT